MSKREEKNDSNIKRVVNIFGVSGVNRQEVFILTKVQVEKYLPKIFSFIKEEVPFASEFGIRGTRQDMPYKLSSFIIKIEDLMYCLDAQKSWQANQTTVVDADDVVTSAYDKESMKSIYLEHNLNRESLDLKVEQLRIKIFNYLREKKIESFYE